MNEKVDVNNIIEVSNTKHTTRPEDEHKPLAPKTEEEQKYHENIISDIYGDLSSSDSDDDEEDNDTGSK